MKREGNHRGGGKRAGKGEVLRGRAAVLEEASPWHDGSATAKSDNDNLI